MPRLKDKVPIRTDTGETFDKIGVMLSYADMSMSVLDVAGAAGLAFEVAGFATSIAGAVYTQWTSAASGYLAARSEIKWNYFSSGFSRGVVMGIDGRPGKLVADYFGHDYIPTNHFDEDATEMAREAYVHGLLTGWLQGRECTKQQRKDLWMDLAHRAGDLSYLGDSKEWSRREWINWYVTVGAIFRRAHME
jgi:hypothetical protein